MTGGAGEMILSVKGLSKEFGGVHAVNQLNISLERGQVLGVIGANGAGKSTLFNLISGALRPTAGSIVFDGYPIVGRRPDQICRLGIARTYQIVRPLPRLTVLDNVMVGAYNRERGAAARNLALEMLEFTGLIDRCDDQAGTLNVSGRKRLEITRALATRPSLLLLDEVMSGLTPTETQHAVDLLQAIRGMGITMMIIEHVMRVIMTVADAITVMHHGELLASGSPQEVVANPAVAAAYLGSGHA